MIYLNDRSNYWCPIKEIDSELKYERDNESNEAMKTLPFFKIRTNHDQVLSDEDGKLSQLVRLAG